MHRIFVPREAIDGDRVVIVGAEAHHIRTVLRNEISEEFTATDGVGRDYLLKITRFSPEAVVCKVMEERAPETPETLNQVVLMQCCLSSGKMDQVIDRATQLGVSRFIPISSDRSKFRGDEDRSSKKTERWSRIAGAAALQSGRAFFPTVDSVRPLSRALKAASEADVKLLLSPDPDATPAHELLPKALVEIDETACVYLLIGPESGFSEAERRLAVERGFLPMRMGHRTIRAETAPIVALALVLHHLGEV
ncbi:MAG: 16S rRNA (uracil(1498)-N(3))-methyltransferase [Candidatus Coatesbacteria bacterium]|nr:16S rRNA (uracil(1498)-N(3))-methyltransferase [Candidatus Coatesbacteria bacterium]